MTSVEEHARHIRTLFTESVSLTKGATELPLAEALGRVTASVVRSPIDLPLFRNSQMDGYAVRSADLEQFPVSLPVTGDIPAGPANPPVLTPGTAVRIMTGAVVPEGADCVVPVEDVEVEPGVGGDPLDGAMVKILVGRASGDFVRDRASDLAAGAELLPAGQLLGARHLAALAAAGITTVPVRRRLRVAVISTGAELVAPGDSPRPGQIFDSNLTALSAAVTETGAELVLAERSSDETAVFRDILDRATALADLVITSGGISEGAYEVVRETIGPLGASVGHIAMQPGGPQATATVDGVPVLCFPGNPVSTQVSFAIFARPLLLEAAGRDDDVTTDRTLSTSIRSIAGKRQFLRGRLDSRGSVELVSGPSSHLVAAMARADVLVDIPADVTELAAGETVRVWSL
ncbi:molybdopterin molybdotransferase MoeA [Parafrigoribacterium humi]|jgi:molybdopterin molybdotransferase|uniref:molybdopterin molybdotransferase MoeA n=1 Tax=Parafrigoribacterium humi TaxID=3144664 RepID=UPI0032EC46E9